MYNKFDNEFDSDLFMYNREMTMSVRKTLLFFVILCLVSVSPAFAQGTDSEYFDETKHNVQGAFWQYYQSIPNAGSILGYPITEEFTNQEGLLVQYFQRARLEVRNGQVQQTPLGSLMYQRGIQLNINNPLACRRYNDGFPICFAFREYFDANGDLGTFGYPISPFEYQNDMIVQYFQNGRMEWHPSNPEGNRVVMADLGRLYFDQIGEDPVWLNPADPLNQGIAPQIVTLNVSAFPLKAVTYTTDDQMVFVLVHDQTSQAIEGATGQATFNWPSGEKQVLSILTGPSGIATLPIKVTNQPNGGVVTVDIQIKHGSLSGQTTTSFRIWY
jgi:hypothetical protein